MSAVRGVRGAAGRAVPPRGDGPGLPAAAAALALGLALGLGLGGAACLKPAAPPPVPSEVRIQKLNEITTLWAQIRAWRREKGMELEPPMAAVIQWRGRTVPEAAGVCPETHQEPPACADVCSLADAICDNAERICTLADELGKDDHLAQDKCASAKASCREAKQRCCACSGPGVPALQPGAPPAERGGAP